MTVLIRLRRIYDFCLFHVTLISLLHRQQFFINFIELTYRSSAKCQLSFFMILYFLENHRFWGQKISKTYLRKFRSEMEPEGPEPSREATHGAHVMRRSPGCNNVKKWFRL